VCHANQHVRTKEIPVVLRHRGSQSGQEQVFVSFGIYLGTTNATHGLSTNVILGWPHRFGD
ncbi:MAG: hypothetical protein ACTSPX_00365, partial [Candidatus Thorarchaeota archaeon]